eukprot:Hpha_TRINITY_DN16281_c3_g3::TRINITY_DN16281_c3_g3_i1::g.14857::m.14857
MFLFIFIARPTSPLTSLQVTMLLLFLRGTTSHLLLRRCRKNLPDPLPDSPDRPSDFEAQETRRTRLDHCSMPVERVGWSAARALPCRTIAWNHPDALSSAAPRQPVRC